MCRFPKGHIRAARAPKLSPWYPKSQNSSPSRKGRDSGDNQTQDADRGVSPSQHLSHCSPYCAATHVFPSRPAASSSREHMPASPPCYRGAGRARRSGFTHQALRLCSLPKSSSAAQLSSLSRNGTRCLLSCWKRSSGTR